MKQDKGREIKEILRYKSNLHNLKDPTITYNGNFHNTFIMHQFKSTTQSPTITYNGNFLNYAFHVIVLIIIVKIL